MLSEKAQERVDLYAARAAEKQAGATRKAKFASKKAATPALPLRTKPARLTPR